MDLKAKLEAVIDWPSFADFAKALATEREQAEAIERANPDGHRYEGALGWSNQQISQFLECAVACVNDNAHQFPIPDQPTWKFLAKFLDGGKFYE